MGEYMKTITDDTIINYWMSFFLGIKNRNELEDLLNNISNKKLKDMLLEYRKLDTSIVESMIWSHTEEEEITQNALDKVDDLILWGDFYEPVLKKYIKKLFDTIKNSKIIANEEIFILRCIASICSILHLPAFETLIAETYYAKKNKLLKGETREDRGRYYNKVLLKDNKYRKEIYGCYPELIRVLDVKTKNTIDFLVDIIKSTESEINNIEKSLNDSKSLGKITDLYLGEGDTHNNGKTVTKLKFDTGKTLIYKPHNLEVEEKYYEFIQWFNKTAAKDEDSSLMAAKCYHSGNHGWMEFIDQKDCRDEKDVRNFYYKMGKLLCILYTTNGIDIHNENIIAHGNMPVLVDLETFLHPDLYPLSDEDSASKVSAKKLSDSVIKNLILPTYIVNKESKKVYDLGGLSGAEEQEAVFPSKFIKDYGTDEVKIVLEHGVIEVKDNNASLQGKNINSKEYSENIILGFKETYNWIVENKSEYISVLKELFEKVTVRILFRPTNSYSHLLSSSYHPNLLTNSVDRFIYLHKFAEKLNEKYNEVGLSEIEDFLKGDIPYFSVKANEREVYGSGTHKVVNILKKTTMDSIESKIKAMNTVDLNRQTAIIRTKLFTEIADIATKTEFQECDTVRKSLDEKLINAAEKIADFILERCITGKGKEGINRTWFGCEENEYNIYEYTTLDDSIYYGLSGIAMFFNYLEKLSKKDKYKNVTKEICDTIIEGLPESIEEFDEGEIKLKDIDSGAFSGVSGTALLLSYIDKTNNEKKYEKTVSVMLELVNRKLDYDIAADVIGHIGALGCMISIYNNSPYSSIKNKSLEIAKKIYNKVKDKWIVIEGKKGITWSKKGYVGYAHGNAGVTAQLYRLYKITGEEEIKDLIDKSLLYEREMYVEEEKNWLRAIDENYCSYGWCHGAPGILLSRIQLMKNGYKDELFNKEIEIAIQSIIDKGLRRDWCLCHGDMGNLSILKEAAIILKDNKLYNKCVNTIENFIDYFMDEIDKESFKEDENNGFMVGLSGVGYELLRVNREEEMPNILSLE